MTNFLIMIIIAYITERKKKKILGSLAFLSFACFFLSAINVLFLFLMVGLIIGIALTAATLDKKIRKDKI